MIVLYFTSLVVTFAFGGAQTRNHGFISNYLVELSFHFMTEVQVIETLNKLKLKAYSGLLHTSNMKSFVTIVNG